MPPPPPPPSPDADAEKSKSAVQVTGKVVGRRPGLPDGKAWAWHGASPSPLPLLYSDDDERGREMRERDERLRHESMASNREWRMAKNDGGVSLVVTGRPAGAAEKRRVSPLPGREEKRGDRRDREETERREEGGDPSV